ncbi:hypothetical protein BBJ28_00008300 [Nothophytophthora sp. Chile5]|nr:hypothetical protein BBJ28_00008300 [Nothophytophthora sp. Chile5]
MGAITCEGGVLMPSIVFLVFEQRVPKLKDIVADEEIHLDEDVEASGFGKEFGESVHDNLSDSEDDDDEEEEEEEDAGADAGEEAEEHQVGDLTLKVDATTLNGQAAGSEGSNDGEEEDDDESQDSFAVENEVIKQRVQKDRQARQKTGGKRRSRNSSKLSVKGKLYHKSDW